MYIFTNSCENRAKHYEHMKREDSSKNTQLKRYISRDFLVSVADEKCAAVASEKRQILKYGCSSPINLNGNLNIHAKGDGTSILLSRVIWMNMVDSTISNLNPQS